MESEERRKYKKDTYYYYKEHHICVLCHKESADKGHVTCLACRLDIRDRRRDYYYRKEEQKNLSAEQRKEKSDAMKRKREKWEESGLCTSCGKRKPQKGYK